MILCNIFKLASGVAVSFFIPKMIGTEDYGYYRIFTLYAVYAGIFHFGFIDGIYLKYGGKNYADLSKPYFSGIFRFLLRMELIISIVGSILALFFLKGEIKFIFVLLFLYILWKNAITYFEYIAQITCRFGVFSNINLLQTALTVGGILSIYAYSVKSGRVLTYRPFVCFLFLIAVLVSLTYLVTFNDLVFTKTSGLSRREAWVYFKLGIPLLLSGLCTTVLLNIDRQFVSACFTPSEYGVYAFSYNIASLFTALTTALSVVLYPNLKKLENDAVSYTLNMVMPKMTILLFGMLIFYFPLCPIVKWLFPSYSASLPVFRIIIPGVLLSALIDLVYHNCFKIEGKEKTFLLQTIAVLVTTTVANTFAYRFFKTTVSLSVATVIMFFVWFTLCSAYFKANYGCSVLRNNVYIFWLIIVFFAMSATSSWLFGWLLFTIVYAVLTLFFYKKTILELLRRPKADD